MNLLEEKLEILKNINPNWLQIVWNEMNNDKEPSNPELVKSYNDFWNILREAFKENREEAVKILQKNTSGDCEWLISDIENSLKIFFSFSKLREFQKVSLKKVQSNIDFFFENVILYYDPEFVNEYIQFDYESKAEFWDVAKVLNGIVAYYIEHHYSQKAIRKDLESETGLNIELCTYISKKIEDNYQTLQLNFIMDSITTEKMQ